VSKLTCISEWIIRIAGQRCGNYLPCIFDKNCKALSSEVHISRAQMNLGLKHLDSSCTRIYKSQHLNVSRCFIFVSNLRWLECARQCSSKYNNCDLASVTYSSHLNFLSPMWCHGPVAHLHIIWSKLIIKLGYFTNNHFDRYYCFISSKSLAFSVRLLVPSVLHNQLFDYL